ncbi:tetratricopeptide repeat protein [Magnetospira sp. QH-2]|uniref:tetratricopeptide repeat-containing glycosyltransferase family protein n=1 Tax=Magnetospira sp. (strain QH-2) TaxID=1288970 RepID=UPI0003E81961|nr:tetratricopeptide repeat-containing glycosyltransferase family protein [Magnetospira sp. QH-2]CCQ75004.1 conserved protein of unknown function with TPR repeats [Magnetospira sp. QH-2]
MSNQTDSVSVEADRLFQAALQAHKADKLEDAIRLYHQVLQRRPGAVDALGNMGAALRSLGKYAAAAACQQRAVALLPERASFHSNLGNALRDLDRQPEALSAHRKAVRLDPSSGGTWYNMGLVLQDLGNLDEAIVCFDKALELEPQNGKCHWDRALAILLTGELERGFEAYEARWKLPDTPRHGLPDEQLWDGQDPAGKTIFLHQEQGFGDTIQFIRYAPMVKALGATVVVSCHEALIGLFSSVGGIDRLVPKGTDPGPFDWHAPLLSLPRIFGTTMADIPATVPYVKAPSNPAVILPPVLTGSRRVGIVWGGSPTHRNDRRRSAPFDKFIDLAGHADVTLVSLQKGGREQELARTGAGALITNLGPKLEDFTHTASAIAQLDLLITVDTSVAHLAGAMNCPAWVLVPYAPDWRWMREREDSPWYPSLRLFRQPTPGDWDGVFERVNQALADSAR